MPTELILLNEAQAASTVECQQSLLEVVRFKQSLLCEGNIRAVVDYFRLFKARKRSKVGLRSSRAMLGNVILS